MTILFVDDDPSIIELYSIYAEELALGRFDVAKDGEEAWALIQNEHYSLIITDLNMPEMNGFELIKNIDSLADDNPHPVVIVSSGDLGMLDKAKAQLDKTIIVKPFSIDVIKSIVDIALT